MKIIKECIKCGTKNILEEKDLKKIAKSERNLLTGRINELKKNLQETTPKTRFFFFKKQVTNPLLYDKEICMEITNFFGKVTYAWVCLCCEKRQFLIPNIPKE